MKNLTIFSSQFKHFQYLGLIILLSLIFNSLHGQIYNFTRGGTNLKGLIWRWDPNFNENYVSRMDDYNGDLHILTDDNFYLGQINTSTGAPTGQYTFYADVVSGRVGIGTTSPELKLDVRGGGMIGLINGAVWDHMYMFHDGSNAFFRAGGAETGLAFQVNGGGSTASYGGQTYTEAMRLLGNGNVGIGTTTPSYKLQVTGDIYANGGWVRVAGNQGLHFESYGGGFYMIDNTWIRTYGNKNFYHNTGIMRTDGQLQVGDNGNRFVVNTAGNVGISTTSPGYKLSVAGNGHSFNVNPHVSGVDLYSTGNFVPHYQTDFTICKGVPGSGSAQFSINSSGNVGIGTTTPTSKLHVNGTTRLEDAFSMAATPIFSIDAASTSGGRFLVNTDGRIGMGVPAAKLEPGCKLSVNGATYIGDFGAGYNSGFIRDSLLSDYLLWVEKGIVSEDYVVAQVTEWDDYVFNENYELPSLKSIETFIQNNKHLPNIPSEAEVKKDGYSVHTLNRGLLKTVEEQTLHIIQQEKKIIALEAQVKELQQLAAEVEKLKQLLLENKK